MLSQTGCGWRDRLLRPPAQLLSTACMLDAQKVVLVLGLGGACLLKDAACLPVRMQLRCCTCGWAVGTSPPSLLSVAYGRTVGDTEKAQRKPVEEGRNSVGQGKERSCVCVRACMRA